MSARAAAAIAAALVLAGCPFHPRTPVPATRAGEWAIARDAATRRALLYDGFDHRATATATHLSLAVREARARRLAEWLGWTEQELTEALAKERADATAGEEFVLAFYTADRKMNDLDAPRSVWRVAVKVEGADLLATRVTSIDSDATTVGLFPYVGPFDTVYRIFLPHPVGAALDGKPFLLEVASALGKLDIDYASPKPKTADEPWQPVPPP